MTRGKIPVFLGEPYPGLPQKRLLSLDAVIFSAWDSLTPHEGPLPSQSCRHFALLFPTGDFAAKGEPCSLVSND